jgi:hypothetical protein
MVVRKGRQDAVPLDPLRIQAPDHDHGHSVKHAQTLQPATNLQLHPALCAKLPLQGGKAVLLSFAWWTMLVYSQVPGRRCEKSTNQT